MGNICNRCGAPIKWGVNPQTGRNAPMNQDGSWHRCMPAAAPAQQFAQAPQQQYQQPAQAPADPFARPAPPAPVQEIPAPSQDDERVAQSIIALKQTLEAGIKYLLDEMRQSNEYFAGLNEQLGCLIGGIEHRMTNAVPTTAEVTATTTNPVWEEPVADPFAAPEKKAKGSK